MALTLACRDTGVECDYVARGETIDELNAKIAKHGIEVHGLSDEELTDPKMVEMIKSLIKEE